MKEETRGWEEKDAEEEAGCHVAEKIVCRGASWGWGWGRGQGGTGGEEADPRTEWGASLGLLLSPDVLWKHCYSPCLGPRAQESLHMETQGTFAELNN